MPKRIAHLHRNRLELQADPHAGWVGKFLLGRQGGPSLTPMCVLLGPSATCIGIA